MCNIPDLDLASCPRSPVHSSSLDSVPFTATARKHANRATVHVDEGCGGEGNEKWGCWTADCWGSPSESQISHSEPPRIQDAGRAQMRRADVWLDLHASEMQWFDLVVDKKNWCQI